MIDYSTLADLEYLIERGLGQQPKVVVRDWGLLDSALHRPGSTVFGDEAYPTLDLKAASLLHSLARNHPLLDGNKRLAWLATKLCYVHNGRDLRAPDSREADALIRAIASGDHEVEALAVLLAAWVHKLV
ncbi:type II toxin-antitoxin system death-on-curing family toxin [Amycolatopsis sp.]|jgi:death-on-curing protein|uniref:type II toxin-antitoxin system death-on-curing family toxin n=1 Tax=Amycolatopsis sp. TaxID=37632 RepID=UPI002DFF1211|nr:Fic family protein [Amycolatopsis sp.]